MILFNRKPEPPAEEVIPQIPLETKAAWWNVFTEAIRMAIDDTEDLLKFQDEDFAKKIAVCARNIADAALAQFEDRWTL